MQIGNRILWRRVEEWVGELRRRDSQLMVVLSVVIGALVGLVVVAFILLTGRITTHLFPTHAASARRIVIPLAGAFVSGWLLYRFFPNARGSGIPQTKAALYIHDGRITLHTVVGKFLCCTTTLASGIALGREGPSVQIGAGLASVLARKLRLSKEQVRALIPVGGAAALAAAFNTPIAAVLFSLEELVGDLHAPVLGSVVLASATSWIVLHLLLGDEPLFHVTPYQLRDPREFIFYAALGVAGGIGSAAFTRLLLFQRRRFLAMPASTRWWQPAIGGLAVGIIGFFVPHVLGVGYPEVERVLGGSFTWQMVLLLAVLKIVATTTAYASGNAGGIFGPSLFIGAMIGATIGHAAQAIAPLHTANPGAYALVGMGAAFAGIVRAPMTSVIMIFEVTRDYAIIVPLMLTNLIAYFVAKRLQPEPIYEALAHQDGLHLPGAVSRDAHAGRTVGDIMQPQVSGGQPFGPRDSIAAFHVHTDQDLHLALDRMGRAHVDRLPVVSREDVTDVIGVVTLADVLRAYGVAPPDAGPGERLRD